MLIHVLTVLLQVTYCVTSQHFRRNRTSGAMPGGLVTSLVNERSISVIVRHPTTENTDTKRHRSIENLRRRLTDRWRQHTTEIWHRRHSTARLQRRNRGRRYQCITIEIHDSTGRSRHRSAKI